MRIDEAESTCKSSIHTQHVKFCAYVAWGSGLGGVVAVCVVFEEGEVGLDDNVVESVLEAVVVVVSFLPSPSLLLVFFLVVLLDCIGTTGCQRDFKN